MSSEYALEVKNVSKSFRLPTEQVSGIKQAVINQFKGIKGYKEQHVLKDISFQVEKGDFFGIVGRNGSGKSTLLKLISQIYTPDSGSVEVNGTLIPFIELGVGFNPELTGRENVYMNGALLGFSREEVSKMYTEIVEFAELEDFMDQKLKNYSSGMQVRLAFSIAIKAQGDILVLDEVLAVGDSAFQQKCFDYFAQIKREKKTVILVSHSMSSVQRFCNKAVLIEKGEIIEDRSVLDVTTKYEKLFIDDINKVVEDDNYVNGEIIIPGKFDMNVSVNQKSKKASAIEALIPFEILINIREVQSDLAKLNLGINIRDAFNNIVFSNDIRGLNAGKEIKIKKGSSESISLTIDNSFTNGEYFVDIIAVDEARKGKNKILLIQNNAYKFNLKGINSHQHSLFHPGVKLRIYKSNDK